MDFLTKEDALIDHGRLYGNHMEAEEILRKNSFQFNDSYNIKILKKIKEFYAINGYIYERKELIKDLLAAIRRVYGEVSIEMCESYHDLGYTFERYQYYSLMLLTMEHGVELFEEYKLKNKDKEKKEEKEKRREGKRDSQCCGIFLHFPGLRVSAKWKRRISKKLLQKGRGYKKQSFIET